MKKLIVFILAILIPGIITAQEIEMVKIDRITLNIQPIDSAFIFKDTGVDSKKIILDRLEILDIIDAAMKDLGLGHRLYEDYQTFRALISNNKEVSRKSLEQKKLLDSFYFLVVDFIENDARLEIYLNSERVTALDKFEESAYDSKSRQFTHVSHYSYRYHETEILRVLNYYIME